MFKVSLTKNRLIFFLNKVETSFLRFAKHDETSSSSRNSSRQRKESGVKESLVGKSLIEESQAEDLEANGSTISSKEFRLVHSMNRRFRNFLTKNNSLRLSANVATRSSRRKKRNEQSAETNVTTKTITRSSFENFSSELALV